MTTFKTKKCLMAASVVLTLIVQSNFALAQDSAQLKEHQKSVGLIDIQVNQLIKDAVANGVKQETIDKIKLEQPFRSVKPSEIKRVFGSFSLPEDLESAMALAAGPPKDGLPFEMFIRVQFTNPDAVKRVHAWVSAHSDVMTLSDGKEYMSPKGTDGKIFFAHQVDATTYEFGTKAYLLQPKRNFRTDQLNKAFAAAPKESVRLVLDLETRRELLKQAAEMAKENLDPISSAYVDLIGNAKSLAITSSVGSENLLSLIAQGNNDSDAEELAEGINGLLGTAKIGFGAMYGQMAGQAPPEMKDSLEMVKRLVDSLSATQSQATVKLLVKKPEGFAEQIKKLQLAVAAQAKEVTRMNEFRQLALGVLNYESAQGKFPFQPSAKLKFNWRVKILSFIGSKQLYDQIRSADGATSQFADKMPEIFGPGGSASGVSWIKSDVSGFPDIPDGASNTIMLIENPKGGPWLEDNPLTIDDAVKLVASLPDGKELTFARYDGSVGRIPKGVQEKTLRALFDPKDGNSIDRNWDRTDRRASPTVDRVEELPQSSD